ncbi:ligase-associated DNA damage response endonuclease PdeM [Sphingopyxis sp.]|uniref:ligase-associated DNA damage response endonuclease PdeM n=1 Tax=Sphingopyxis sp. TaxID=1908224 RepID=UPI002ED7C999
MSPTPNFVFAGQQFRMLTDRALFWPRHGALIVADLHLEKASWFAALGQPLPPYDSHDTLDRLAALATETGARAIWCLGDCFHDRRAAERIAPAVAARLRGQATSAKLLWIAGNHDGLSGGAWGGEVADELLVDGIVFRHQSLGSETRPEISGHFHPKLRLNIRGRPVSRPCFACDDKRLILPAFGSLTGGLAADDPVIAENFAGAYQAMLVARGRRLCFPCRSPIRDDATATRAARAAKA